MRSIYSIGKLIKKLTLLFLLCATIGCTREDISDCNHYLRFQYDYNLDRQDRFAEQVEQVKVFIFDSNQRYLTTLSESGEALKSADYKLLIPYDYKDCIVLVWAGKTDQFYSITPMRQGDSIEKMALEYLPEQQNSNIKIDNLWHSGPIKLTFPEDYNTIQTVSLIKNTNDIHVNISNEHGSALQSSYKILITSANGSYNYKNEFLSDSQIIKYSPYNDNNGILRILRLLQGDRIFFSISDSNGRSIDIGGETNIDLIDYFIKSTPLGMSPQEYLDRGDIWNIDLILKNNLALCISINGWVYWFHPTDI